MKKIFVLAATRQEFQAECERIFSHIDLDISFKREFDGLEIAMGDVRFFYVTGAEMLKGRRGHLYIMSRAEAHPDWQAISHVAGAGMGSKELLEWRPKK